MEAKEFRKEKEFEFDHFLKLTSTGIKPNYTNIEMFANEYAKHYHKEKLNKHNVKECGVDKTDKALEWWQDLIENDLCDDMEKKHGFYGHDIGSTKEDIIKMYEMECDK